MQAIESCSGKYTCKIENEAGVAESIADIIVKKKCLSPVFLKRLQSKYLEIGQRLIMEAEIGGTPEPKIFWYFNENEILGTEGGVQLRKLGCHVTLIIDNVEVYILIKLGTSLLTLHTFRWATMDNMLSK